MCGYFLFYKYRATLIKLMVLTRKTRCFSSHLCRFAHRRYLEIASVELSQNLKSSSIWQYHPAVWYIPLNLSFFTPSACSEVDGSVDKKCRCVRYLNIPPVLAA